jgi:hypothetical protein
MPAAAQDAISNIQYINFPNFQVLSEVALTALSKISQPF